MVYKWNVFILINQHIKCQLTFKFKPFTATMHTCLKFKFNPKLCRLLTQIEDKKIWLSQNMIPRKTNFPFYNSLSPPMNQLLRNFIEAEKLFPLSPTRQKGCWYLINKRTFLLQTLQKFQLSTICVYIQTARVYECTSLLF